MTTDHPTQRVQRVRHELKIRHLTVARVEPLSPHFKSITFTGEALSDFSSVGFDDHVKVMLDIDSADPVRRDYTPRRFDRQARELTIEFALHDEGRITQWAIQAQPGHTIVIGGPRGSFIVPTDYAWHLLVGDETAMPAIRRRLEELPAGSRVIVLAQIADPADRLPFKTAAQLELHWVQNADELLAAARALRIPDGEGYAWGAGEASAMASLRRVLVEEKGLDRHAMRMGAYWKRGAAGHHEKLED
jgi:NADPH-dependent ferric siderophore reductase